MLPYSNFSPGDQSLHLSWPELQFCVVQNKNSFALVSQFETWPKLLLNSLNTKPWSFNRSPYPSKKSTTSWIDSNPVPYGTVITFDLSQVFLKIAEFPPCIGIEVSTSKFCWLKSAVEVCVIEVLKNLLIYFTATISEFQKYKNFKSIRRIDYYSYKNTYKIYNKFDGLIYPSRIESLGLPLQEAVNFKIPILCSDLPYSRELLKEYGHYFNQESKNSLRNTILHFMKYTKRNVRFNNKYIK